MNAQVPATAETRRAPPAYAGVGMSDTGSGGSLAPKNLGDVVAFATVMARADIALPKHLRNNDGACLAVSMQAMRWEMDPFAVANKSYSVNDRLAYEAQLVAAVVHTRAPIKRRPDYAYDGTGPTRRCIVSVEMLDGTTKVYESPTFASITTKNSPLWKSDPDQQLGYFAIRSWARRHAPEVILGVYTPDELIDSPDIVRNVTPTPPAGLTARLQAANVSGEGFNASQREDAPHDPQTGEIVEAEFTDPPAADDQPGPSDTTDTFPGDAPADDKPDLSGMKTGAELLAEQQAAPKKPLAERIAAFKAECAGKGTAALFKAWRASSLLRNDIDAADPEEFGTSRDLETWWQAEFDAAETKEKGGV